MILMKKWASCFRYIRDNHFADAFSQTQPVSFLSLGCSVDYGCCVAQAALVSSGRRSIGKFSGEVIAQLQFGVFQEPVALSQ
jgi:hypothetical protein